ncbi:hypothetical protein [Kitasatospora sp. NPDC050543]|uniref:hypothetical protein n=1 Tax=Kitasatospora sp. NPDC050543 TaxID=3364054 RepID=UPI00379E5A3E
MSAHAQPGFGQSTLGAEFLRTLHHLDAIRWPLAPSHGVVHLRLPCPRCGVR